MQSTELSYRRTAAEGATGFGLLIMLYDTLAGHLRRAAEADRKSNLEQRCQEVNHAFLVIGYHEDAIGRAGGGDLAQQLVGFYATLRRKLLEAQVTRSPELLDQQMDAVLRLRASWQTMDLAAPDTLSPLDIPAAQAAQEAASTMIASRSTSWSA
jgi:flagellin-specific chaperone FliS